MIYYKIRCKSDPTKFVSGTPVYHSYDSLGRFFPTIGKLRTFLTLVMNRRSDNDIGNWEIVELEMVIKEVKGVHEVITQKKLIELLTK